MLRHLHLCDSVNLIVLILFVHCLDSFCSDVGVMVLCAPNKSAPSTNVHGNDGC